MFAELLLLLFIEYSVFSVETSASLINNSPHLLFWLWMGITRVLILDFRLQLSQSSAMQNS